MKRLVVLVVGMCWLGAASAATNFSRGLGGASCGEFLAAQEHHDVVNQGLYEQWAQGFLTGRNVSEALHSEKVVDLPDPDAMDHWLTNWCTKNPLVSYGIAVSALMREVQHPAGSP